MNSLSQNKITHIQTNEHIDLNLHSYFIPHSAWVRNKTEIILKHLQNQDLSKKLLCIDWNDYTSNIEVLTDESIDKTWILLPAWIDGIISTTKRQNEIILPVWDCAAIAAFHKWWEINWLFHAWYKWVAWLAWNDLWMIVSMLEELKNISNSNNLDNFNFYLSPMMWLDFELPRDYVTLMFNKLFNEYNLNENKYFSDHKENSNKIYLNLKQIILDIFKKNNIKIWKQVKSSTSVTNKASSSFPSFRLHSIANSIENKLIQFKKWEKPSRLTNQEFELELSGQQFKYLKNDYRLALSLKNYKKETNNNI